MLYRVVLIAGSRDWMDRDFMARALQIWTDKFGAPREVVEGCARGADSLAGHDLVPELWPDTIVQHFPADWDRHGKAAGPIRNQQMLDVGQPDALIAFTPSLRDSRGTADMVRRARKAGLRVWLPVPGSDNAAR